MSRVPERFGVPAHLPKDVRASAVLDGEIVCLAGEGRPPFYSPLYRRGHPIYAALGGCRRQQTLSKFNLR